MTVRRVGRYVLMLLALSLPLLACTSDNGEQDALTGQEPSDPVEADDADDDAGDDADTEGEPEGLEAQLAEIAEQVSVLRDLRLLDDIQTEVVEPEVLAEIVTEQNSDDDAVLASEAAERVLIALRHLPEGADLAEIRDNLLGSSVLGLYDAEEQVAYVTGESEVLPPGAASTAAHELLHALQDQHFDLTRLDDIDSEDGDAALAFLSVVEGDAVIAEEEWQAEYLSEDERAEADSDQLSGIDEQVRAIQETPSYIVESLIFPYVAGERFVAALINEGGYEAVDAALEDPPTTTLEIIDPDSYLAGDLSLVSVEAGAAPGDDWESAFRSSFGVFDLLALFGAATSSQAAQGSTAWPAWRGGALEAWERDDELVVSVAWSFEDDERATTVCEAVPAWYGDVADGQEDGDVWRGDRDVLAVQCDGDEVRFSIGPDAETAQAVLES